MKSKMQTALIITRREIRDQFRDWRIIIPILLLTLIFPAIMNFTADQAVQFVEDYGATIIGDRLIPFLLMIVGFFPISISLVIALESFVGEKERRSIEPLLSTPLSDWQLYVGKLLAVLVPPLLASFLGIVGRSSPLFLVNGNHDQAGANWLDGTPNNPAVTLREVPASNYAVIRFSGFAGEDKIARKTADLMAWLDSKSITPTGKPQLARYNPPWTLPFLRRNEVLVAY